MRCRYLPKIGFSEPYYKPIAAANKVTLKRHTLRRYTVRDCLLQYGKIGQKFVTLAQL